MGRFPMAERIPGICEGLPDALLADSGYFSQQTASSVCLRPADS